jgi:cytochrome c553
VPATAPWARLPPWWRVIAWTLLVAAAVWAAHGLAAKVAAGVLMAVAALGTQLSTREDSAYRPAATLVAGAGCHRPVDHGDSTVRPGRVVGL